MNENVILHLYYNLTTFEFVDERMNIYLNRHQGGSIFEREKSKAKKLSGIV